jgi:hypothetical protein
MTDKREKKRGRSSLRKKSSLTRWRTRHLTECSQSRDGPTLEWYRIQEDLEGSAADTLLLLDCCFAAQAGRGRDAFQTRLEILAAAAMGVKTPMPGPRSFTQALINELKTCVDRDGYVYTDDLHRKLVSRKANLHTTPIRISLTSAKRPLKLYPLSNAMSQRLPVDREGMLYQVIFRTDDILQKAHIEEIAEWLGQDKPMTVTAVGVRTILQVTSQLKQLMDSLNQQEDSLAKYMEPEDLGDIFGAWYKVVTVAHLPKPQRNETMEGSYSSEYTRDSMRALLRKLETQNNQMATVVRRGVMNSVAISDQAMLSEAISDPTFGTLGIADQLRLRQMIQATIPFDVADGEISLTFGDEDSVLREYKNYGRYIDPAEMPELKARVGLLASLLNAPKSRDFLSLPCRRWFEEPLEYRFVLEFEIPQDYDHAPESYQSLQILIRDLRGSDRPTLNTRLRLAYLLAKAIEHWHSVGWVHQGISCHNILLLRHKSTHQVDYSHPILLGFEFARPKTDPSIGRSMDDIAFNVYRHPERQGVTRKGHTKIHDIYSLGVVLLEIGLWQTAVDVIRPRKKEVLSPSEIQQKLYAASLERVAHYAGQSFRDAVAVCLSSSFNIAMDDSQDTQLARSFQRKVVDKLAEGVPVS